MNAGFSNLDFLKKQILAESMQGDPQFDDMLVTMGRGVVGQFERKCNREFQWMINAADVTQGDRDHWYARRYPVAVFSTVNLRYFRSDPWTDISGQPMSADEQKGLIHFGYTLGVRPIQVQIIYNGGYWWNTLEPKDPGYAPNQLPNEITQNPAGLNPNVFLLPPDLLHAWILQCKHVWRTNDKIGTSILEDGTEDKGLRPVADFAPGVESMLQQFVRYQLT